MFLNKPTERCDLKQNVYIIGSSIYQKRTFLMPGLLGCLGSNCVKVVRFEDVVSNLG